MNSTDTKPRSKAEREADDKAKRRAEAATIVAGLKQALEGDEQLLGFARGRLAGGIRGKMSLGPEAFFAPFVNIGLTERRLVIQHINAETGRPGEILPHYYALGDIAAMNFSDIETFGGEAAARLTMRLRNDQHTRLRLRGQGNFESAQAIVEVFRSLTLAQRPSTTPTQRVCAACRNILDQPFKFCPYCGQQQDLTAAAPAPEPIGADEPERRYPPTPPGPTEPDFLDTVPYQDAGAFRGPTVEDGLDFLTREPVVPPADVPPTPSISDLEPEAAAEADAGSETPAAVEETAFETPSAFEGWSVDPGASAAVVEPSDVEESAPTTAVYTTEPSFPSARALDTEASVAAAAAPDEAHTHTEPTEAMISQTNVYSGFEETAPKNHAEPEVEPVSPAEKPPLGQTSELAPPSVENFAEFTAAVPEHVEHALLEPTASAPTHENAGFETEAAAVKTPTPVSQDFEPFAPVASDGAMVPEAVETGISSVTADVAPPDSRETATTLDAPKPEATPMSESEAAPVPHPTAERPSEERFAALLKEIRGGEDSPQSNPAPPPAERRDGPMSVHVQIDRPPIKVNETFVGRNADEVVAKLKAYVLPELPFAARLMANSFSNLRFAQEIVNRYNAREKTHYPVPNSCWEFLKSAETMGFATIHVNS